MLEGARNFRDFGGFLVRGGASVRRGVLFRSNNLSALSGHDKDALDGLAIKAVFDLRIEEERERHPTCWSHPRAKTYCFDPGRKRRLVDMAAEYPATEAGVLSLMKDFYAQLPLTMAHIFADIIRKVAGGAVPCIIHCSAGKDRTGVAVALLLSALGVDRKDILADYALTQPSRYRTIDMAQSAAPSGDLGELIARYPPQAVAAMSEANPLYLVSAFGSIEDRYGSVTNYLRDGLGLEEQDFARLRQLLCELIEGEEM